LFKGEPFAVQENRRKYPEINPGHWRRFPQGIGKSVHDLCPKFFADYLID